MRDFTIVFPSGRPSMLSDAVVSASSILVRIGVLPIAAERKLTSYPNGVVFSRISLAASLSGV